MVNILCFGDSNTWGYQPLTGERYPHDIRWTGKLQQLLGKRYHVYENGLNGRTTCLDEPGRVDRNGLKALPMLLECHRPLEMLVVMLGTNDLKSCYGQSAENIAANAEVLCQSIQDSEFYHPDLEIILVSPTLITEVQPETVGEFANAQTKSKQFGEAFKVVAKSCGVHWFDAASIVHTSNSDGIHWEGYQHNDFAMALNLFIQGVHFGKQQ